VKIMDFLREKAISVELQARGKEGVIRELVHLLVRAGEIKPSDEEKVVPVLLAREGFAVVTTGTFADALDAAERFRPAVALVDWVLPVSTSLAYGNGIDLVAAFQSRFSLPSVLVTGHEPDRAQAEVARRNLAPAPPILRKPLDAAGLRETMQKIIAAHTPQA